MTNLETDTFSFEKMNTVLAMDLAKKYLFPLFTAMALFLIDVRLETHSMGTQLSSVFIKRFITCFIIFAFAIVFSIMVNRTLWGWLFFIVSWISLTALKLFSFAETETVGVKINND